MTNKNDTDAIKKEQERLLHNAIIYMKIYDSLIEKAIPRGLKRSKEELTEIHHIVPKCLGGTDDKINLVQLTTREHVVAHMLLQRMYPDDPGLSCAITLMFSSKGHGSSFASSRTISMFREETRKILSEKRKGRVVSEETKQKLREINLGNKYGLGRIVTEEVREKLRIANTGKRHSEETKRKISEFNKGNKYCLGRIVSEETRQKLKAAASTEEAKERTRRVHTGKIVSEDTKQKLRELAKGNKRRLGKTHTEETKRRIKEACSGKNNPVSISIIDNNGVIYESKAAFLKENKMSFKKLSRLLKDPDSGIKIYKE